MSTSARSAIGFVLATLLCSCAAIYAPQVGAALEYNRTAVSAGEVWRLLTGQLVHLGWVHLLLNITALAVMAVLCERFRSQAFAAPIVVLVALSTLLGLHLLVPDVQWYRGASGVLHGLALWLMLDAARIPERRLAAVVAIGVLSGKLVLEYFRFSPLGSESLIGGRVVHEVHCVGSVTAIVVYGMRELLLRVRGVESRATQMSER